MLWKKQLKWYEERSYILDYVVICSSITGPTVPLWDTVPPWIPLWTEGCGLKRWGLLILYAGKSFFYVNFLLFKTFNLD